MVKFELADVIVNCDTKPDLFSPKNLDTGTRLLLNTIEKKSLKFKTALDWGCGWGAISITLAKLNPNAQITAIDSDIAAISTTKKNIEINNTANVEVIASHGFDEITDKKFELICSNPPTHRGRKVVEDMITQSFEQLSQDGVLAIVVEARLKPWVARQITEVFGSYKIIKRGPKHVVLFGYK